MKNSCLSLGVETRGHTLRISCSASGSCSSVPTAYGKGHHEAITARHPLREGRVHAVAPSGLHAAACHVAGGLCHRRWARVVGAGPQPFPPGDVYRQCLTPCRARGRPWQSADGGLHVTVRAAVQTVRYRHPLHSPRLWRGVSAGVSPSARPSCELLVLPGGDTVRWMVGMLLAWFAQFLPLCSA
jgi:hypothetical protein